MTLKREYEAKRRVSFQYCTILYNETAIKAIVVHAAIILSTSKHENQRCMYMYKRTNHATRAERALKNESVEVHMEMSPATVSISTKNVS